MDRMSSASGFFFEIIGALPREESERIGCLAIEESGAGRVAGEALSEEAC